MLAHCSTCKKLRKVDQSWDGKKMVYKCSFCGTVWDEKPHLPGTYTEEEKESMIRDYQSGKFSGHDIQLKYGISTCWFLQTLKKRGGKARGLSEGALAKNDGWRMLPRMAARGGKKALTRTISLPHSVYSSLGFRKGERLYGLWQVAADKIDTSDPTHGTLVLYVSKRKEKGFVQLYGHSSRIFSLPSKKIHWTGMDPSKEMMGKWLVEYDALGEKVLLLNLALTGPGTGIGGRKDETGAV